MYKKNYHKTWNSVFALSLRQISLRTLGGTEELLPIWNEKARMSKLGECTLQWDSDLQAPLIYEEMTSKIPRHINFIIRNQSILQRKYYYIQK
jgi:hypothetical protein